MKAAVRETENLTDILGRARLRKKIGETSELSYEQILERKAATINGTPGDRTGYDCQKCMNRGYMAEVRGNEIFTVQCECVRVRKSLRIIEESGLKASLGHYTFDRYICTSPWQDAAKKAAIRYADDTSGAWFYLAGSVGSGKTHLCTAICSQLMSGCHEVRYMKWRDDAAKLKANVNNPDYEKMIKPYKTVEVLYVDDFWKGGSVTDGDINLAFEILNTRYTDPKLKTILSSERTIQELMRTEQAIGSRIFERSGDYCISIVGDGRNYRMKAGARP